MIEYRAGHRDRYNMEKANEIDLLTTVESGGCSAKLPAAALDAMLRGLPFREDENLLVGNETRDDAAVYRINKETALVTTTDFFPPVCSDPYDFGRIAATNALSDIYAMGGRPLTALNLVMFPSAKLDMDILRDILRGGADAVMEADTVLSGGHTIDDDPPKYGLAVTGIVHPEKIVTNGGACPGDTLVLTKPLGTGIIVAGRRINEVDDEDYQAAVASMKRLNRDASEAMLRHKVVCATDVTGFSLLGHGREMALASNVRLVIRSKDVPALPGVLDLLDMGCIPGAGFRNLSQVETDMEIAGADYEHKMLLADAQTSGGLLMSCPSGKVAELMADLEKCCPEAAVIGRVEERGEGAAPLLIE